MQITGNQNGFSFFSAYKVAAAPKSQTAETHEKIDLNAEAPVSYSPKVDDAADTHREGLLLEAAHRTAAKTAEWTEALAVL